jgi:MATE family multidrug resistance protein
MSLPSTSDIIKKVLNTMLPLTASRLLNVMTSFLGVLLVAHLGKAELAASALITATQVPLFLIASSPLFAMGVVAGHAFGAKRYEDIGEILQQGWLLALIISAIVFIVPLSMKHILLALGQDPQLANIVQQFFSIYAFAIPGILGLMATQQFLIAIGKQRFVMWLSLFSFICFTILAPIFIYGIGFIPGFGVPGLALASTVQSWLSLSVYLLVCAQNSEFVPYKIFTRRINSSFNYIKQLIKIGWPITLQMTGDLLSFFVITIIVGLLGENALAANQIVTQYYILLVVPILTMSQASSILISQARGAKDFNLIKRYGNTAILLGGSFALLITFIFILFPHEIIKLYLHSHIEQTQLVNLASILLILTGFRLVFDTILEIKVGNLRGLLDTRGPMFIMLFFTWLCFIPIAYFVGIILHYGLIGITVVGMITTFLGAVTLWLRWHNKISHL